MDIKETFCGGEEWMGYLGRKAWNGLAQSNELDLTPESR
jgi:hypothetical protein